MGFLAAGWVCRVSGDYVLGYLSARGPESPPFVVAALVQLLCRITKLGWLEGHESLRQLVPETVKVLEVSACC